MVNESRLFAAGLILAVLLTFGVTAYECGVATRAEQKVSRLERQHGADLVRWQVIADKCATNAAGGLHCPDGTLRQTTTSTTVAK